MDSISARAVGFSGKASMPLHTQNVDLSASLKFHNLGDEEICAHLQNVDMFQVKNGGSNFLKAWREKREMSQQELADAVGTTASVISYLELGERGLSAKWLRRLAPPLGITPGILLDNDPADLSDDMIDMWVNASARQRKQITEIAKTIISNGTDG